MLYYIVKRILYAIPIIMAVNVLTFSLFFIVNTPDDMARMHLGYKRVTPEAVARWKHSKGFCWKRASPNATGSLYFMYRSSCWRQGLQTRL